MKHLSLIFGLFLLVACGSSDRASDTVSADGNPPLTQDAVAEMSMPDVADRLIEDAETLSDLLASVDGEVRAEEVRPRIEAMMEDYRLIFERFESMGDPSFSDMAALASRAPQLARMQEALVREVQRIHTDHPEAADVLRKTLDNLGRP